MEASEEEKEKLRFEAELEFVQCLANPHYLNHLAQNLYFEDEAFLSYLEYLSYWKQPAYVKFIQYPTCLSLLDLLQDETFRNNLKNPSICEQIAQQQWNLWQYGRSINQLPTPATTEQAAESAGGQDQCFTEEKTEVANVESAAS